MRSRSRMAVTSIGLVVAISAGVFASASFATKGMVSQQDDVLTEDIARMPSLRTRGGVKVFHQGESTMYRLDFTATFTPTPDGEKALHHDNGGAPDLVMMQSIGYPTLSDQQEYVGPVGLPFSSQQLQLTVQMNGECFEPFANAGWRLVDDSAKCVQAWLALGDAAFDVTELFAGVDSRLMAVGRDGRTWMWRSDASFRDPGYPFPIASLGNGGSMTVVIGDMGGTVDIGGVKFSGAG